MLSNISQQRQVPQGTALAFLPFLFLLTISLATFLSYFIFLPTTMLSATLPALPMTSSLFKRTSTPSPSGALANFTPLMLANAPSSPPPVRCDCQLRVAVRLFTTRTVTLHIFRPQPIRLLLVKPLNQIVKNVNSTLSLAWLGNLSQSLSIKRQA